MGETIVVGVRELNDKLRELTRQVSGPQLQKAMMQGGLVIERAAKQNVRKQKLIDTGNLRDAITAEPQGYNVVVIGPGNVIYAAIHEFGGTITPKSATYLAVPMSDTARATGSPRGMPGLRFVPTASGGVLMDRAGTAHYALVKSVTIPARPYLRPALDEHGGKAIEAIEETLRGFIEKV